MSEHLERVGKRPFMVRRNGGLNTRGGIKAHAGRMGPAYERMGAERGQHDPWTEDLVAKVEAGRRAVLPLDQWEDRAAWRDRSLMALLAARQANPKKNAL